MNLDQLTELQIYHGKSRNFSACLNVGKDGYDTHLKRLIKLGLVEKAEIVLCQIGRDPRINKIEPKPAEIYRSQLSDIYIAGD